METISYHQEDFPGMDKFFRRNLINCLSGFKSLNLVGTISPEGQTNLSPFSQVFHVGATPALAGLLIRPDTVPRHTLQNIEATSYYTFNHVRADFFKQAHQTSARYQESEFEATGLHPTYTERMPAPYVQEAWVKIGLKFEERINLKINGTILVIGSIVEISLPKEIVREDGFLDLEKAGTVTCSGLDCYHQTQKLARLSYAKPDRALDEIG